MDPERLWQLVKQSIEGGATPEQVNAALQRGGHQHTFEQLLQQFGQGRPIPVNQPTQGGSGPLGPTSPQQQPTQVSAGHAFMRGLNPFDTWSDELAGIFRGEDAAQRSLAQQKASMDQHPMAMLGGGLVGGLASMAIPGAAAVAPYKTLGLANKLGKARLPIDFSIGSGTLSSRMARGAMAGGAQGAAQGLGYNEEVGGPMSDRFMGGLGGTAVGGVGGALIPAVGVLGRGLVRRVRGAGQASDIESTLEGRVTLAEFIETDPKPTIDAAMNYQNAIDNELTQLLTAKAGDLGEATQLGRFVQGKQFKNLISDMANDAQTASLLPPNIRKAARATVRRDDISQPTQADALETYYKLLDSEQPNARAHARELMQAMQDAGVRVNVAHGTYSKEALKTLVEMARDEHTTPIESLKKVSPKFKNMVDKFFEKEEELSKVIAEGGDPSSVQPLTFKRGELPNDNEWNKAIVALEQIDDEDATEFAKVLRNDMLTAGQATGEAGDLVRAFDVDQMQRGETISADVSSKMQEIYNDDVLRNALPTRVRNALKQEQGMLGAHGYITPQEIVQMRTNLANKISKISGGQTEESFKNDANLRNYLSKLDEDILEPTLGPEFKAIHEEYVEALDMMKTFNTGYYDPIPLRTRITQITEGMTPKEKRTYTQGRFFGVLDQFHQHKDGLNSKALYDILDAGEGVKQTLLPFFASEKDYDNFKIMVNFARGDHALARTARQAAAYIAGQRITGSAFYAQRASQF